MLLKEIFDKAENGTMTYEQLEAAMKAGNAKFVDLAEGNYVSKQKYEDELKTKDTQINNLNGTLNQRDTDLADLKAKLESAGTDATKLGQLSTDLATLQTKYDADVQAYQDKLNKQAYEFAVKEFAGNQKFSSNAAKRDFINSMMAKNLQIDNGVIIGATDFMSAYSQENADAFVTEKAPKKEDKPHFVDSTNPGVNGGKSEENPFHFDFAGVRPHK